MQKVKNKNENNYDEILEIKGPVGYVTLLFKHGLFKKICFLMSKSKRACLTTITSVNTKRSVVN